MQLDRTLLQHAASAGEADTGNAIDECADRDQVGVAPWYVEHVLNVDGGVEVPKQSLALRRGGGLRAICKADEHRPLKWLHNVELDLSPVGGRTDQRS
jgi:hypothetical protein